MKLPKIGIARLIIYPLVIAAITISAVMINDARAEAKRQRTTQQNIIAKQREINKSAVEYKALKKKMADYQKQGIKTESFNDEMALIKESLFRKGETKKAEKLMISVDTELDRLLTEEKERQRLAEEAGRKTEAERKRIEEENKTKGTLKGTVKCANKVCANVLIQVKKGNAQVASVKTNSSGQYSLFIKADTYNVYASLSGYATYSQAKVIVTIGQTKVLDMALSKPASTGSTTQPLVGSGPPDSSCPNDYSANGILCWINKYRRDYGREPVTMDPAMNAVMQKHVDWMAATGTFSHTGEGGSSPWQRCIAGGTNCAGEIIASAYSSWQAVNLWMNSCSHRTIMLGPSYRYIGIGVHPPYTGAIFR